MAGFAQEDIDIVVHENALTVTGKRPDGDDGRQFLHQGIAGRSFERRFQLAEHVKIDGASLKNGLLNIQLKHELPEAKKPRKIAINGGAPSNVEVLKSTTAA